MVCTAVHYQIAWLVNGMIKDCERNKLCSVQFIMLHKFTSDIITQPFSAVFTVSLSTLFPQPFNVRKSNVLKEVYICWVCLFQTF